MSDYERLRDELDSVVDRLTGLGVPDADLDQLIWEATEKLRDARDLAGERS